MLHAMLSTPQNCSIARQPPFGLKAASFLATVHPGSLLMVQFSVYLPDLDDIILSANEQRAETSGRVRVGVVLMC
jgi:hypothetical protein